MFCFVFKPFFNHIHLFKLNHSRLLKCNNAMYIGMFVPVVRQVCRDYQCLFGDHLCPLSYYQKRPATMYRNNCKFT